MASTTTPNHDGSPFAPFTPINKNVTSTPSTLNSTSTFSSKLRDSPFSDYFTDDGRSLVDDTPPSSPEKQHLLMRMKQLQVLLMQGEQEAERETLNIVARKIAEIETQLSTMHSQTRMPPELEDSGLFMEDDEDDEIQGENVEDAFFEPPTPITILSDAPEMVAEEPIAQDQIQPQRDELLAESQKVLQSVSKAQEQLRERCKELKALNDRYIAEMDELRAENEALKSNLESNTSDLHFLHHKFRKLEIEVQALDAGAQRLETYAPEIREDIQRVKRKRMSEEMGRWEQEWSGVATRMNGHRASVDKTRGEENGSHLAAKLEEEEEEEVVRGLGLETIEKKLDNVIQRVSNETKSKDHYRGPKIVGSYPRDSSTSSNSDTPSTSQHNQHESTQSRDFSESAARDRAMTATTVASGSSYNDHLVLTATGSPVSQSLFDREYDTDEDDDDEREGKLKLDCAITTSSEDNVVPFSSNKSKRAKKQSEESAGKGKGKTAWRELVDGLSNLAGMGEWE